MLDLSTDSVNAVFGRVGRIASEDITLQLYKYQVYSYFAIWFRGICPLLKLDLSFLDLVINRLFIKLFKTNNKLI